MFVNGNNIRVNAHGPRSMLVYTTIFICVFATYLLISLHLGILNALPEIGDGQAYDSIAFNIANHRGFGHAWDDPNWRHPYLQDPQYQDLLSKLPHSGYYPDVYRPPAMPYLLALVYGVFGRNFAAWRLLSCAIMAGAATIAAAISAEFAGVLAAIITALLILQCPALTWYSHFFLTESLATFLLTLLAWTWLRNTKRGWTTRGAAGLGIVLGALVATRNIFLLWVPILPFFVPAIPTPSGLNNFWRGKAICLSTSLLILSPWVTRNIIVTKEFMPFGAQAQMELLAGFSPQALQARGLWQQIDEGQYQDSSWVMDPVDFQVRLAKFHSSAAAHWMIEHPFDVMRLMVLHVWHEVEPRSGAASEWLLFLGALSAFVFRKSHGVGLIVLFVALNILSIALTWSVGGRFMVPVQPLIVALVGAMVSRQLTASLQQNSGPTTS